MADKFKELPCKISLEQLEDLGDSALGVKVIAVCHGMAYCGVIKHILKEVKRIWLIKCFTYPTGIPIVGVVTLFYIDIVFISLLKIDEEVKRKFLKKTAEEVNRNKRLVMGRLAGHNEQDEDDNGVPETIRLPADSHKPPPAPYGSCVRLDDILVLNYADDQYTSAINHIINENVVGLVVRGPLGRNGEIGWISVATATTLYHFNVVSLNFTKMMAAGFRSLLEHPHKVKVIHDARDFQDYLLYRHKCSMCKVFDIQFTDWYLRMNTENTKEVNRVFLTKDYLQILKTVLHFEESHIPECASTAVTDSTWLERPLSEDLIYSCDFSAIFLFELRQALIDLSLAALTEQTDIFIKSISKMDQYSAKITEHMTVPYEVLHMWEKQSSDKIIYTEHPTVKMVKRKY